MSEPLSLALRECLFDPVATRDHYLVFTFPYIVAGVRRHVAVPEVGGDHPELDSNDNGYEQSVLAPSHSVMWLFAS